MLMPISKNRKNSRKKQRGRHHPLSGPPRAVLVRCGWFLLLSCIDLCFCAVVGKQFGAPPALTASACISMNVPLAIAIFGGEVSTVLPRLAKFLKFGA